MDGDLGVLEGMVPAKFEVGVTAHVSVPPIFREVVLSEMSAIVRTE